MSTNRKTKVSLKSIPSWVEVQTLFGSGNGESEVVCQAYTGRENRNATIVAQTTSGSNDSSSIVQNGKPEHITVTTKTYNISQEGGDVEIEGISNSATLVIATDSSVISGAIYKLEINTVADESWNGNNDVTIDGDPGASAEYQFKLIVTLPTNQTESSRNHVFEIKNSESTVTSGQITISQGTGSKTYSDITITGFSYGVIPAGGGSVNPTITYTQTWGWNGSTTGGGTITSGATLSYAGSVVDSETGAVNAESKEQNVSAETTVDNVTVTVNLNGKTKTAQAEVKQAANSITYGNVIISGGTANDIPASGGSVSALTDISATQTISYTSGAEKAGEVEITYSSAISAGSLGTTIKSRTKIGTLTATATGEGSKSDTKSVDVYQVANAITTYGEISLDLTTPVSIQAQGQTYDLGAQVDAKFAQTITYTSGATRQGEITEEEYIVATAKEGFSLNPGNGVVTVVQNPGTSAINGFIVNVTVTGEGSKQKTTAVTFNQQGSESYIEVTPESLEFEYTGGSKQINISSNDSWTIS